MISSSRSSSQYLSGESPGTSRLSWIMLWSSRKTLRPLAWPRPKARATTVANRIVDEVTCYFTLSLQVVCSLVSSFGLGMEGSLLS